MDLREKVTVSEWRRPLAFVLSGGGAWGASQVGMISALDELGITPDLIVGTSVGALNGALLAAEPETAAKTLHDVWLEIDQQTIFGGSRLRAIRTLLKSRGSYLSAPDGLVELITRHTPVGRIENLALPFGAVATDALSGDPVVFDAGDLRDVLLASSAIPGVFPPVEIGGRTMIDGGVVANIPIRQALARGAATTVVLDATPAQLTSRPPRRPVARMLNTAALMLRSQASADLTNIEDDQVVVQLPKATPDGQSSFHFADTPELVKRGRHLTLQALG